jgi:hypothetical protein
LFNFSHTIMSKPRVLLISSQQLFSESIEMVLRAEKEVDLIGPWNLGDRDICERLAEISPSVIVIADENLQSEIAAELTIALPKTPIDLEGSDTIVMSPAGLDPVRIVIAKDATCCRVGNPRAHRNKHGHSLSLNAVTEAIREDLRDQWVARIGRGHVQEWLSALAASEFADLIGEKTRRRCEELDREADALRSRIKVIEEERAWTMKQPAQPFNRICREF